MGDEGVRDGAFRVVSRIGAAIVPTPDISRHKFITLMP